MTEITKFDPSTLMQGVRDRVKATFVSLIPDDQWEKMIKKECDDFFTPIRTGSGYRDSKHFSDFQSICFEVMKEVSEEKIKELLLKEYNSNIWENNSLKPSDALKDLLIKHAPEIFTSTLGSMFQNVINNMQRY